MKRLLSRIITACGVLFTACGLSVAVAASDTPDAQAGEELYINGDTARGVLACVTCHGEAGNSVLPANPNLAGQPYEYIIKQLTDFSPGGPDGDQPPTRGGPNGAPSAMAPIAQALSNDDIVNIAYYLSQQPLDYSSAATATQLDLAERGQQIWRAGLPERRVPACAACHAPDGTGLPAEYPRLAGQFPGYIAEQLKSFRSSDRANSEMMHEIADRMSDSDIAAVADYAAGLR